MNDLCLRTPSFPRFARTTFQPPPQYKFCSDEPDNEVKFQKAAEIWIVTVAKYNFNQTYYSPRNTSSMSCPSRNSFHVRLLVSYIISCVQMLNKGAWKNCFISSEIYKKLKRQLAAWLLIKDKMLLLKADCSFICAKTHCSATNTLTITSPQSVKLGHMIIPGELKKA